MDPFLQRYTQETEGLRRCKFFFFLFFSIFFCEVEAKEYGFQKEPIDVIIPCCEKDLPTIELSIEGVRKNVEGARRVIVVSERRLTDSAEWFDEKNYPFSKNEIAQILFKDEAKAKKYLERRGTRIEWIYQQLLKVYVHRVIDGLSSNCLVVDADTIFLNNVNLLSEEGAGYLHSGSGYHAPNFEHARRLLSRFKKIEYSYTGQSHYMLLQRPILEDLFNEVEAEHQLPFWRAFCGVIDPKQIPFASVSEYEIYYNFALSQTNQVKLKPLKWKGVTTLKQVSQLKKAKYHYISCHGKMGGTKRGH